MPKAKKEPNFKIQNPGGNLCDIKNKKRGILFLETKHDDPWKRYSKLKGVALNQINTSFSSWIQRQVNEKKHHGYSNKKGFNKYKKCYTFKYRAGQLRFHGLLVSVERFQFCIITNAETKKEDKTNKAILERVRENDTEELRKLIIKYYHSTKSHRR